MARSIIAILLSSLIWNPFSIVIAFTHHLSAIRVQTGKQTTLNAFKRKSGGNLPQLDPTDPRRYIPPQSFDDSSFYPSSKTLMRSGPLPFITRLTNPDKYEQAVYNYMYQSSEKDLEEAQANMDAYFSSPTDWAEQKMMEQRGERQNFRYSDADIAGLLKIFWRHSYLALPGSI